jgi:hypothetical protein
MALVLMVTLAAGLTSVAHDNSSAVAQHLVPIGVRLRCLAALPSAALRQARTEVVRIYRMAGVQVAWLGCIPAAEDTPSDPAAECTSRPCPLALTIVILPRSMRERLQAARRRAGQHDEDTMGMAPGTATERGQRAYVFYDRIDEASHFFSADFGQVFGHAIAHEMGHLLLPYPAHSRTGLMRATWVSKDFQDLARGAFLFTAEQAALLRSHWRNRATGMLPSF